MIPKLVLFCTDFSENSNPARQYAVDFAKAFGADLMIVHVVNSAQLGYPSLREGIPVDLQLVLDRIQESVDKALDGLCDDCRRCLDTKVRSYSCIGSPAYEIASLAVAHQAGLIVMGTHGWTGIKHMLLGSTAENVIRLARCPVLTVKPRT